MPLNPLIHFAILIETVCQSTPNNLHSFGFCFTCLKCPFSASHSPHHIHITLTDYSSYRHPSAKYRTNRKIIASNSSPVDVDLCSHFYTSLPLFVHAEQHTIDGQSRDWSESTYKCRCGLVFCVFSSENSMCESDLIVLDWNIIHSTWRISMALATAYGKHEARYRKGNFISFLSLSTHFGNSKVGDGQGQTIFGFLGPKSQSAQDIPSTARSQLTNLQRYSPFQSAGKQINLYIYRAEAEFHRINKQEAHRWAKRHENNVTNDVKTKIKKTELSRDRQITKTKRNLFRLLFRCDRPRRQLHDSPKKVSTNKRKKKK